MLTQPHRGRLQGGFLSKQHAFLRSESVRPNRPIRVSDDLLRLYLLDEVFDRSLSSTHAPHVIETDNLPLHAQQHCSAVQSHPAQTNTHANG